MRGGLMRMQTCLWPAVQKESAQADRCRGFHMVWLSQSAGVGLRCAGETARRPPLAHGVVTPSGGRSLDYAGSGRIEDRGTRCTARLVQAKRSRPKIGGTLLGRAVPGIAIATRVEIFS